MISIQDIGNQGREVGGTYSTHREAGPAYKLLVGIMKGSDLGDFTYMVCLKRSVNGTRKQIKQKIQTN
jgi:hypothetical protein